MRAKERQELHDKGLRKCSSCGKIKPLSEFSPSNFPYFETRCKQCNRERGRKRYAKNPQRERDRTKDYYRKHHKKILARDRKKYKEDKKAVEKLLGKKCFVCGVEPKRIIYHEIHNQRHPICLGYILKHIQDFIPLCNRHHLALHLILEFPNKFKKLMEMI